MKCEGCGKDIPDETRHSWCVFLVGLILGFIIGGGIVAIMDDGFPNLLSHGAPAVDSGGSSAVP
jgi:hypothetical protein